jgi:hypothetical protein
MKLKYFLTLQIVFVMANALCGQSTLDLTKDQRVKNAYGFLLGQEYSLNLVKVKFPNFSNRIIIAEELFNAEFGGAKEKMKDYLTNRMGDSLFKTYFNAALSKAKEMSQQIEFRDEIAVALISDVYNRANGQIPSPTLETLLYFKYLDYPEKEFTTGCTQVFKTKGHPKSKGTDWQIKVPKSWKAQEGDRPNIIQKFTSDFGDGKQIIMLMVKDLDLPQGYKITKQELTELFTEKAMKEMVDKDSKYLSFTKMTLDSQIGGMLEMEKINSRLDKKIKIRMVSFIFVRNAQMYFLQGMISTDVLEEDLSLQMKKFLPLYKLVANSIVVNDQYK